MEDNIGRGRGTSTNKTRQYKSMIEDARAIFNHNRNEDSIQQVREGENVRAKESRRRNWHEVPVGQSDREGLCLSDQQRLRVRGLSPTVVHGSSKCDLPRGAIKFMQNKDFGEKQFYFAYKDFTYADYGSDGAAKERFRTSVVGQMYVLYIRKNEIVWNRENSLRMISIFGELEVYLEEQGVQKSSLYDMLRRYENEAEVEEEEFGSIFIATAQSDHEEFLRKQKLL
jgi:hypothetical protein